MKKQVKIRWVFWVSVCRYQKDAYWKTRGANFWQIVWKGFSITIGLPWAMPYIEYELTHFLGKGINGIEKNNKEILANRKGISFYMPPLKYKLNTP